jgi:hypothetical protein
MIAMTYATAQCADDVVLRKCCDCITTEDVDRFLFDLDRSPNLEPLRFSTYPFPTFSRISLLSVPYLSRLPLFPSKKACAANALQQHEAVYDAALLSTLI